MDLHHEIKSAHYRISPYILKTPLFHSTFLSELNEGEVFLKLESEQYTGSFKARGALNKVLKSDASVRKKGFLTASTGNHAQGFARAVSIASAKGIIYLPENADQSKIVALKYYDAELQFFGHYSLETELYAKKKAEENGMTWISPYNDPDVIGGQGTIALEITSQMEGVDAVLGCIGGGGMMSGVASWFEKESPKTSMVGCLPENSPEMKLSVEKGKVVVLDKPLETLSDGSAGGLEEDAITFDICRRLIKEYYLISEKEIADAIRFMVDKHHKIVEGSAGVAIAGFMKNAQRFKNQKVVIIVCGGNISTQKLKGIL